MTGKEKHDIPIQEAVEPFLVVKGKKRRWFEEVEMGDENPTVRKKKKGRKGKGKRKAKEFSELDEDMEEAGDGDTPVAPVIGNTPEDGPQESIRPEVEELVLAIHKIDSFETARGKYLVFSAVGYALCSPTSTSCPAYVPLPVARLCSSVPSPHKMTLCPQQSELSTSTSP